MQTCLVTSHVHWGEAAILPEKLKSVTLRHSLHMIFVPAKSRLFSDITIVPKLHEQLPCPVSISSN